MSPWAPNQASAQSNVDIGTKPAIPQDTPSLAPWWMRAVPFFLSAFLFLSAIFAVFSPLPLLLLHLRSGRKWAWLGIATNAAIIGLAAGKWSLAIYLVFIAALGLVLPEFLKARKTVETAAVWTLFAIAVAGSGVVGVYSYKHHLNPVVGLKAQVSSTVDLLGQAISTESNLVSADDLADWKHNLLIEFPSAVAVFALILIWANLSLLLRANPAGIREKLGLDPTFLKRWKTPEWMIWPTIASGFFLLVDAGPVTAVSLNVFKFLMAVYAIQGLSILSFFFDLWNVRGIFRIFGFVISIFVMMPLLLSLGFFDLWFDFRAKFRQS